MRKIEELKHLLDIAKMNYRQLGGVMEEDEKKQEQERESARCVLVQISACLSGLLTLSRSVCVFFSILFEIYNIVQNKSPSRSIIYSSIPT